MIAALSLSTEVTDGVGAGVHTEPSFQKGEAHFYPPSSGVKGTGGVLSFLSNPGVLGTL